MQPRDLTRLRFNVSGTVRLIDDIASKIKSILDMNTLREFCEYINLFENGFALLIAESFIEKSHFAVYKQTRYSCFCSCFRSHVTVQRNEISKPLMTLIHVAFIFYRGMSLSVSIVGYLQHK